MQPEQSQPGTPLPFDGADNFRELGGYPVQDGRHIRRGVFWRTGALGKLVSEHDRSLFLSLGIRSVLDLRSSAERQYLPDPPWLGAKLYTVSAILDEAGQEVNFDPRFLAAQSAQMTQRYLEADIPRIYERLPFANPAYRQLFACVLSGQTPILFHCTAGKDRTGVAAALLLLALGADRQTVRHDYLLTNRWRADSIHAAQEKEPERADLLLQLMSVRSTDLDRSLQAIDRRYPSIEAYFFREYGLDAAALERLRDLYLE